jgi:biotin operon repressor
MDEIRKIVQHYFKLDISEKSRRFDLVFARACYFKICRDLTENSYQKIGASLGKNHATVMHGIKTLKDLVETDKDLENRYYTLLNKFSEYNKIKEKMTLTQLVTEYNKLVLLCGEKDAIIKNLEETIYQLADLD